MEDFHTTYALCEDVYKVFDVKTETVKVIKLEDDNYFFQAKFVAGEILNAIDGKTPYSELVEKIASAYDPQHHETIRAESKKLLEKLLTQKLIKPV